ncbi:MAG: nucleotide exchange factor GrpE, partial [Candidatus Omnitrophica bacterium]|nr:nucleotide exchange factor GrpE [Candidatus Omnitrophota bacterium]
VYDLLRKNDVAPIEAKGKMFDPHCHEALLQEERDDVAEGTVIDEFQKGYMMGDRVIRTNKVKVAKKKDDKDIKDNQKN